MNSPFYLLICSLLAFTACRNASVKEIEIDDNERRILLGTIDKFNAAFAKGNLAVLDSMTTENYVHTNGNSKAISKTDWFKYLKKRNQSVASGAVQVLDYRLEETQIEYHGNTAIVTGRVMVKNKDSSGEKQNQYRITNLWVYENGQWKRAGFHDGKIE